VSNVVEFIYKLQDRVSDALKKMEENSKRVHDQMERAKAQTGKLESTLGKVAGRYLSFAAVVMGGRAIAKLGMDMEATKAKFEVLLGSVERGNKVFTEVNEMAKLTPFTTSDVVGASEQLLAFNYDAEKLMPTLRMLGDVAMGDAQKLSGLTTAFAKVSSTGKLTARELMQMVYQGFNPLVVMSEKTGKSMETLNEEMARGQITFAMVEDAFRTATSEGGRFHGMMDKMGETGRGKLNTLMGALQIKLAELGEKMIPYLNKVLDFGLKLVDNFDRIAKVIWQALIPVRAFFNGIATLFQFFKENGAILALTATLLVSIKLAMLQASLAAKGLSIGSMLASKAFQILNATMLKNPFTAVLVGITLLVGALVMMRKRTKEANSALGEINRTAASYEADERSRLNRIFDALKRTNPQSEERNKLIKQLKEMYPGLIDKMELEKAGLDDLEIAYKNLSDSIAERARKRAYEDILTQLEAKEIEFAIKNKESLELAKKMGGLRPGESRKDAIKRTAKSQGVSEKEVKKALEIEFDLFKIRSDIRDVKIAADKFYAPVVTNSDLENAASVSGLTGAGSRPTNITINLRNLIEYLNMYPQTVREGVSDMENQLIEGLLRVVNSANRIAAR